jgi:hypothetical protein
VSPRDRGLHQLHLHERHHRRVFMRREEEDAIRGEGVRSGAKDVLCKLTTP